MRRLLTALALAGVLVPALFLLDSLWFFGLVLAIALLGAGELIVILRRLAPGAPYELLYLGIPALSCALVLETPGLGWRGVGADTTTVLTVLVTLSLALVVLTQTPIERAAVGAALLALAVPYLALTPAAVFKLHRWDPWLVFLLAAVVVLGDTAAYYAGRRFGRHKMAPVASPKKTWEGAIAGFATSILCGLAYSLWRLEGLEPRLLLLAVCAVSAVAGQLGDLAESTFKRGAAVKDSGTLLPGHGGVLDRIDALLFASPVFLLGLLWTGLAASYDGV
ncbi:MAG TPA: phosphatidate cytidylyltransferase [Thermoanaerobaculia bacterium]|nr:phosphatidate cytidylyltransferase [Thermoanaerobaculia bacterium]